MTLVFKDSIILQNIKEGSDQEHGQEYQMPQLLISFDNLIEKVEALISDIRNPETKPFLDKYLDGEVEESWSDNEKKEENEEEEEQEQECCYNILAIFTTIRSFIKSL